MSVGIAVKLSYLETAKLFLRDSAKKAKGLSEEMARITLFVPSTIAMLNRNMEGLLEELRVFDKSHADFFAAMSRLELMPAGVKEMKQKMSEYIAVIWEIRKDLDKRATTPEKEFLTNTQLQQDLRQDFKGKAFPPTSRRS